MNKMYLNTAEWKEFRFGGLISKIYKAKAINKDEITETEIGTNSIRYITRTSENNGCELLAEKNNIHKSIIEEGNAITIGDTTATCFYQEKEFIAGDHMVVIRADWLNRNTALFVLNLLDSEQYKYSYGRAYLMDRIKDTILKLPATKEGNPDWKFMEDYINSLYNKPLTTSNKKGQVPDLNVKKWKPFYIQRTVNQPGLFVIENCKCNSAGDLEDGNDINYIGAKKSDNGVMRKVAYDERMVTKGHGILFICDGEGSVGYTNYMDKDFIGSTTISIGYDEEITELNALFLVSVLDNEKFKYSYGRKYRAHMAEACIYLPILYDSENNPYIDDSRKYSNDGYVPDWKFMEDYIKTLPYGDRLKQKD